MTRRHGRRADRARNATAKSQRPRAKASGFSTRTCSPVSSIDAWRRCWDPPSTTCLAKHVPGLVLNGVGAVELVMGATGPPLGLFPDCEFSAVRIALEPRQLIMLVTDGVTETSAPSEEPFGTERATECVRACSARPARDVAEGIYRCARAFAGDQPQHDDMTAVIVKVEAAGLAPESQEQH